MNRKDKTTSIVVLGDSSATLYMQEDPLMTSRQDGHLPWPELLPSMAATAGARAQVTSLAGVGQALQVGLDATYRDLAVHRPDVVVLSHGGREAVVALPTRLHWLRCYAHGSGGKGTSRRSWLVRTLRRPLWKGLVAAVDRGPRISAALLRLVWIRPVQGSTSSYAATLERMVQSLVEEQGVGVVLVTSFPLRNNYWPVFWHILRANDVAAVRIATKWPGRVSVLSMSDHLSAADYSVDGAHLTVQGHTRAAALVWQRVVDVTPKAVSHEEAA